MKIKDTINFIDNLIKDTEKKSEKNLYKNFCNILLSLENKDLDKEKIILIEKKLDELDLTSVQDKRVKYLKWKFTEFTQFLEKEFSLIEQSHYVSLGMVFWMMFGLAIGTATWFEFGMWSESTWWLIWGMIIGIIVWSVMDSQAEKENRVLKNKWKK